MDGRYDLRRIADVVRRSDADVAALQEVDRNRKEQTNFDDQPARLEELTGMNARYGVVLEEDPTPASDGEPRQMGQLVLSDHPIESADVHHLPSPDGDQPRAAVRTRIDVDGTELRFVTTHLGIEHGGASGRSRTCWRGWTTTPRATGCWSATATPRPTASRS